MTQTLETGKIYKIFHHLKGKFEGILVNHNETWATILITKGRAKAILQENEVEKGGEVIIRKEYAEFKLTN